MSRHSILIIQCNRLFPLPNTRTHFHFNFPQNRCDPARFCAISLRHFVYSIPLLSAHTTFPQLHFVNAVVKLLFPSTFSPLYHSNHTNYIAASITQKVIHLLHLYNIRHFHIKTSFSSSLQLHFSSPSTPPSY